VLVSVGTFNLNNLFSRWNFAAAIDALAEGDDPAGVTVRYEFSDAETMRVRMFRGRLVEAKSAIDTTRIAERISRVAVDVLAVQEAEDIGTLRQFNTDQLGGLYPHAVLLEGNDVRFIDIGVLSRLPLGAVTTHQAAVHPEVPGDRVFSRDLLEVEVLDPTRRRRLFSLFTTHLKSQFVPFDEDPVAGKIAADSRRRRQAETLGRIVAERQRPNGRYVILGDMNDVPDSDPLAGFRQIEGQVVVDGLAAPVETRPAPADAAGGPPDARWTHRFKPAGLPARYDLFDQIWLSPALAARQVGSFIDRRIRLTGDGSDHDLAWVLLDV
jgi:endonuclease/exonuclease/phosphatase family metal-dependent hydrolase